MSKPTSTGAVSVLWPLADLLRGSWKQYEYQDVILPLVLLKRLDTILAPTRDDVRRTYNEFKGKIDVDPILRKVANAEFYNTSNYDFTELLNDPSHIADNFRIYILGFSPNVQEIFEKFDFDRQLERLEGGNILYELIKQLNTVNLSPGAVDNHQMGTVFEELLRKFAEQSNETSGEHFTPRDVVTLLAELIIHPDREELKKPHIGKLVYDCASGTGGILSVIKDTIQQQINPNADISLYGQELNPQTYALSKADMLIKGENPNNIKGGDKDHAKASTLSNDQFFGTSFDYLAANPPYGVDWKKDKSSVDKEAERGYAGRFGAGTPRISDGQLLFLQHLISKMRPASDGGARIGIVLNGSPLFTGSAGSGESEIRRWILEKDLLETIVALPDQLFYNTGINTYIWILTNKKSAERKGKVQLVDARTMWHKQTPKSLGNKRKEIKEEDRTKVLGLYEEFKESKYVKIFDTKTFGYRQIVVERPLQLSFQVTPERIEVIKAHKVFAEPPASKAELSKLGDISWNDFVTKVFASLSAMPTTKYKNIHEIKKVYNNILARPEISLMVPPKFAKVIFDGLSEHDELAEVVTDSNGNPEADASLRDTENIPLGEDVQAYFGREVIPYVSNAWINTKVIDHKDGMLGKVGYEIPFTRFFYEYKAPRHLKDIEKDIQQTEQELAGLLKELTV